MRRSPTYARLPRWVPEPTSSKRPWPSTTTCTSSYSGIQGSCSSQGRLSSGQCSGRGYASGRSSLPRQVRMGQKGATYLTNLARALLKCFPNRSALDNDVQSSYIDTIIRAMPVAEAHARFPQFQQWLKPISRYDWSRYNTLGGIRLDFWDKARFGEVKDWDNRYCEIRYHFIRDLRINNTGRKIQMGVPGASWAYEVPSVGDLITWVNPFNERATGNSKNGNRGRLPHLSTA